MSWSVPAIPAPGTSPVSLAEAKAHVRVDDDADDTTLAIYSAAARAHVENYCSILLGSRSVTAVCDSFADFACLPFNPTTEITAIKYTGADGDEHTLDDAVYDLRADRFHSQVVTQLGQRWPVIALGSRITLTAKVGAETIDNDIKLAMLLLIGHWYESREAAGRANAPIPHGVDALLANHRVVSC